ncbi:SusC/RagA family TonB-linked outer membrane protein [Odoribacter sp. AF15-53]|uniref:SusC/RagA family TonB-linked outer membrane protein n=1 Tax=Odoribacter sp. AF15-53 TaxID=2292236 RepID=UPI001F1F30E0|nr:SusC/RagA family TonB-linked outer membrane protein [Odoribacter sp. AF15-53]
MKKKWIYATFRKKMWLQKMLFMMSRIAFFILLGTMSLSANVYSQSEILDLKVKNATLAEVFKEITKKSGYDFLYNYDVVESQKNVSIRVTNMRLEEVLKELLGPRNLTYEFKEKLIVVRPVSVVGRDTVQQKPVVIKGTVRDEKGGVLPGVTVLIKGTKLGVATDNDGVFRLEFIPRDTVTLLLTFVGMENKEVKVWDWKNLKDLNITMREDKVALEDVVVTGYANIKKSSFTGTATQVKREDILKVAGRNVIDALQVFDPSLRIMKNNLMGSDPNTLPEFYVRGRSGIAGIKELDVLEAADVSQFAITNNPNTPIFILDGFEVSVEKVYDFDVNRIKDITILKDAAATAMYGSRASNGVVVIETIAPRPGRFVVSYSGNYEITAPDLSSYNMMNARENLEAEWAAGVYASDPDYQYYEREKANLYGIYLDKRNAILAGGDYYWLSQPLTTMFNHKHSLYVEGGSDVIRFGIELRYDNQNGVMKESFRNRIGAGLTLEYRYKGFQMQNKVSYDMMRSKASPYGSFGDYTNKHPYEHWKDKNGKLLKKLPQRNYGDSFINPLYEATLGNFNKSDYKEFTDNLSMNWYVNDYLLVKGQFAISYKQDKTNVFTDPESAKYGTGLTAFLKGELTQSQTTTTRWNTNVFAAYNRLLGLHNLNFSLGFNATYSNTAYSYSHYRGFPDANRHSPAYAYEVVKKPTFSDNKTRLFGAFLMMNYSYNDIYLADVSFRYDGSSEFGSDNKWAPFWSVGAGINLHNYAFIKGNEWITQFRIKGNVGQTGKSNFQPYMARNTYEVLLDDWYQTGIGANLIYMGNDDLTWEKQLSWNIGTDITTWKDRLTLGFDYYYKKTIDLVTEVSLPSSSGFGKYTDNIGEILNEGIELDLNVRAYSDKDWDVIVFGNLAHNKNKILKISESLKQYNERIDEYFDEYNQNASKAQDSKFSQTFMKYEEGSSLTAIYGMKSLGINPANGQEVYMKRDGTITYTWESSEQQKIGDTEPKIQGAFGLNLRFRNFTFYTTFLYECGGDEYNSTLVNNVENANLIKYNADNRVTTDRWLNIGDVVPLKDIKDRLYVTRSTSRFVQKNNNVVFNSLSVGYDVDPIWLRKIYLSSLRVQFNMKDLATMSTIKREMGLNYPFARTFTFTLNASF